MSRSLRPAVLALTLLTAGAAAQTPTWEVEFLGAPGPSWSLAGTVDVSDAGVVVGNAYLSGWKRAWVASPGAAPALLPLPQEATWAEVNDLDEAGRAVGSVLLPTGSRGILWSPGAPDYTYELVPDGPGGAVPFDAQGINDAGEVVGKLGVLSGSYLWNGTTVTQLTSSDFPVTPIAINAQRQIFGDSYRMDLDTMVLENLGNPTGTSYSYIYTRFLAANDAGEAVGYSVTATSLSTKYLAVRYTDGPLWKLFSATPKVSASALGISAAGDTVFQLGASFGTWVYVQGVGSIGLSALVDPADADWDVSGSFPPAISRGGRLACTSVNGATSQAGVVLLTPAGFDDLGGASPGSLSTPVLSGYGTLVPSSPTRVRVASAAPGSAGGFFWATGSNPVPLFGGTLFANPPAAFATFPVDLLGRAETTFSWPAVAPGTTFTLQVAVADPAATGGFALSNALQGATR